MEDIIKDREYYDNMILGLCKEYYTKRGLSVDRTLDEAYFNFLTEIFVVKYFPSPQFSEFAKALYPITQKENTEDFPKGIREYFTPEKLNELGF